MSVKNSKASQTCKRATSTYFANRLSLFGAENWMIRDCAFRVSSPPERTNSGGEETQLEACPQQ